MKFRARNYAYSLFILILTLFLGCSAKEPREEVIIEPFRAGISNTTYSVVKDLNTSKIKVIEEYSSTGKIGTRNNKRTHFVDIPNTALNKLKECHKSTLNETNAKRKDKKEQVLNAIFAYLCTENEDKAYNLIMFEFTKL